MIDWTTLAASSGSEASGTTHEAIALLAQRQRTAAAILALDGTPNQPCALAGNPSTVSNRGQVSNARQSGSSKKLLQPMANGGDLSVPRKRLAPSMTLLRRWTTEPEFRT